MQDGPAKEMLLDAVAAFLLQQVKPAVADPALAFRVLIAANLATVAAAEIRAERGQNAAELARLQALLPEAALLESAGADAAIGELNAELARRFRAGAFDAPGLARATDHIKKTLAEKLAVNNPRFDLSMEIEARGE